MKAITIISLFAGCLFTGVLTGVCIWNVIEPNEHVPDQVSTNSPTSEMFLWNHDTTRGISVTWKIDTEGPKSREVIVVVSDEIAEYWSIEEAALYYLEEGKRLRALIEGPFPCHINKDMETGCASIWTLRRLSKDNYEFTVLLHKKKDGMPHGDICEHLNAGGIQMHAAAIDKDNWPIEDK